VSFSESFDPDDPALIDRYQDYTTETDLGDRPPTVASQIADSQFADSQFAESQIAESN
jgi:hypothetical protein